MKRLLSTLAVIMVMASMYATGYETINGLRFFINTDAQTATLVAGTVEYSGDIVVPKKVTLAGIEYPVVAFSNKCFYDCDSLTSVVIPSSVTSLGEYCFWGCNNLISVNIPSSIKQLRKSCFRYCSSLASVIIPSSVTSLDEFCFSDCTSLKSIVIPSSVKSVGGWCFLQCSALETVIIPSSVTSLGYSCFKGCRSIHSLTLPSSMTKIGYQSFTGCYSLDTLYCYAQLPPEVESAVSNHTLGINSRTKIYVPYSSIEAYSQAEGWNEYVLYYAINGTKPEKGKCIAPYITYTNGKLHFESPTPDASYHYAISSTDMTDDNYSDDGEVTLVGAYNITAYATADNYSPSDKATATLYWIDGSLETTNINAAKMRGILASSQDGIVTISGLNNGELVSFYSTDGKMIGKSVSVNGCASYAISNIPLVIVRIGASSIKVMVK